MIPLALVTGFLGSGKTSFLRHLAGVEDVRGRSGPHRRLAFVVNDFSAAEVDADALADLDVPLVSLPGGSIFCRCLTTSFLGTLQRLERLDPPVDGVVIEASGMADPRAVGDLLREARLDTRFALASVLALVDPATFRKLLATLPAVRAQIETADLVLLNKADLHSEAALRETESAVHSVRPDTPLLRCVRGAVELALFQGSSRALRIHAPPALCRDAAFCAAQVAFDPARPLDAARLCAALDRHADVLWRAKGFVPTAAGLVEIQWTLGAAAAAVPVSAGRRPPPRTVLALIVRGGSVDALDRIVAEVNTL